MSVKEFLDEVLSQPTWVRGGERAPHKFLTVLFALGRSARGDRLTRYKDAESSLRALLERFGPHRESHHPEQPVWRLARQRGRRTRFWNLTHMDSVRTCRSNNPSIADLREHVSFGFSDEICDYIQEQPGIARYVGERLADELVPATIREELLTSVGLSADVAGTAVPELPEDVRDYVERERKLVERVVRDARFRKRVLEAYDYRCAVCSVQPRIDNEAFGLEAAHIRWVQANGADETRNGLCLCRMHHIALDRGAIGIDEKRRVQISSRLAKSPECDELFWCFNGKPILVPSETMDAPLSAAVLWHNTQVFKR